MASSTIHNPMAWKLAGTGSSCNIPQEIHEMLLVASYTDGSLRNWTYTMHIPSAEIAAGKRYWTGLYANAGAAYTGWNCNGSQMSFVGMWVDNNNVTAGTVVSYYYR